MEISELNGILNKDFKRSKDGLYLAIYNPNSDIRVEYFCATPERDAEQEITHYVFKPVLGKYGQNTTLLVFND